MARGAWGRGLEPGRKCKREGWGDWDGSGLLPLRCILNSRLRKVGRVHESETPVGGNCNCNSREWRISYSVLVYFGVRFNCFEGSEGVWLKLGFGVDKGMPVGKPFRGEGREWPNFKFHWSVFVLRVDDSAWFVLSFVVSFLRSTSNGESFSELL